MTHRGCGQTFLTSFFGVSAALFLARASVAAAGTTEAVSPETLQWFQTTEQALMDALAPGDKAVWDRIMDPSCLVATEEGQVVTKQQFLDEVRPLPEGLAGGIAVKELTVQEFPAFALVRYLADEWESVFGQRLTVQYRVTNAYRRDGPTWKMVASHLSVVTRDPPAQDVSKAGWPGLVGQYRLLPNGWTFTVELRDGELYGGRDPKKLRRLVPLTPDAFVVSGSLGDWVFVVENGKAARILNLRKFAPLVWTRTAEAAPSAKEDKPAIDSKVGRADVNGLEMYYEIHGRGRPLVLLHGGLSTIDSSFEKALPTLAKTRQVIAVLSP